MKIKSFVVIVASLIGFVATAASYAGCDDDGSTYFTFTNNSPYYFVYEGSSTEHGYGIKADEGFNNYGYDTTATVAVSPGAVGHMHNCAKMAVDTTAGTITFLPMQGTGGQAKVVGSTITLNYSATFKGGNPYTYTCTSAQMSCKQHESAHSDMQCECTYP